MWALKKVKKQKLGENALKEINKYNKAKRDVYQEKTSKIKLYNQHQNKAATVDAL